VGEFAIASHMAIISIYLLYYLTNVHHFPGALAGTLILIPRLANAVTDPLMGGVSDRVRSRWGRRRPFLLAGSLVWAIAYAAMFWMPMEWSLFQKSAWFLVACLFVNMGLSLYHVPYSAMLPEMTRNPQERLALSGYKEIAARFAVLLTVMASPFIVKFAPTPLTGYRWVGLATGAFILFSGLTVFFATARAPCEAFQPQTMSWRQQLNTFRQNRQLFRLSGAFLLSSACDAFYSAMMIYFLTVSLRGDASLMGVLYPTGSLTAMAMTVAWSYFGKRVGRKRACELAFIGTGVVFALALLMPPGQTTAMYPYMIVLGAFMAGMFLLPSSMTPDTVELDEQMSGQRREGAIYGAWIFTQQTGMAFGAFLVGIYLDLVGYQPALAVTEPERFSLAIKLGFGLVPAFLMLLAVFLIRPLTIGGRTALSPEAPPADVFPI
jgi:Na+/melibiose symporter and related transporters